MEINFSMSEAENYKQLGNAAFKEGKNEEAIQHYSKAIEINPNDQVFYSNRSGCHANLKNYDEALKDAKKCVELKPDWLRGYQRMGLAEFYLKNYDDAIETYKKGLEIDPNNAQLKVDL